MSSSWIVSFYDDVAVSSNDGQTVIQQGTHRSLNFRQSPPEFHHLFEKMAAPGIIYSELLELVFECHMPNPLARMIRLLQYLARWRYVTISVVNQDQHRWATLEPISPEFKWPSVEMMEGRFQLSRFAYLRRIDDALLLESPLSFSRVTIHDPQIAAMISELTASASAIEISERLPKVPLESIESLLKLLHATQFITKISENGRSEEDERSELDTWEFQDLLFHSLIRLGRTDAPIGATYRFVGQTDPPPVVKPIESDETIELEIPDARTAREHEPAFCEVVDRRQSIREFGDPPLNLDQLSEFLYRTARVRHQYTTTVDTPTGPLEMDFVSRPYPSGGGLYELEVYPLVQRCDGLNAGLYRYDAVNHQLISVADWSPVLQQLVAGGGHSTGIPSESIQIVLILSSRFPRVAWKYSSIAYALTLKHVGVLYQTMYLTATAMGLAPCATGSGNSDLFANAIGSDYFSETSVGEFLLGSRGRDRENSQE